MERARLLTAYIQSWLDDDKRMFLDTLHADIHIVECHGASYVGKNEADCWFEAWNAVGKVLSWEIAETYYDPAKDALMATWVFQYQHPDTHGLPSCFDGISVLNVREGRIIRLYEYSMKHDLYRPYRDKG